MSLGLHPINYTWGIDRRALAGQLSDWYRGKIRLSELTPPSAVRLNSNMTPDGSYPVGRNPIQNQRPWVTSTAPIAADPLGTTWPAGTVFIIMAPNSAGGNLRAGGVTTNPLTGALSRSAQVTCFYRGCGIPPNSVGTLLIKNGAATVSTLIIDGANGCNQYLEIPAFTTSTTYSITWSVGVPLAEGIGNDPEDPLAVVFWAVPGTLPGAFTARFAIDTDRGGSFQQRSHADNTRTRSYPNQSYETLGLAINGGATYGDVAFGCMDLFNPGPFVGATDFDGIKLYNCWIGQQLRSMSWLPMAKGTAYMVSRNPGWSAFVGYVATVISQTTEGFRYLETNGSDLNGVSGYQKISRDPLAGDTLTITIKQDGVTISTQTYVGAAIKSIPKVVIACTLPAHGTRTIFTSTCSFVGANNAGAPYFIVAFWMNASPRCDIPFPFSCAGPGNLVAPGGYLPSDLGTPINGQPLVRLAAGVATTAVTVPKCFAFLPASDGWQKVVFNGVDQFGIGEDAFGWIHRGVVQRGHTNRPFYCIITYTGVSHNAVLTAYTPPLTAISGLTDLDLTVAAHLHWAWASYATGGTRDYIINVCLVDIVQLKNGLIMEISGSDSTVLNYDHQEYLETYDELYVNTSLQVAMVYKGTANAPPGSAANGDAWAVLSSPTGLWAGHPNYIAVYDGAGDCWVYIKPRIGGYMIFDATHFAVWGGPVGWVTTFGSPVWKIGYYATTGTFYLAFSSYTTERSATAGHIKVSVT